MIYCDTSYLMRLYLEDVGWEDVRALCEIHTVATADHAKVEVPSALHRAWREGRLDQQQFQCVLQQFELDCAEFAFIWQPISEILLTGMIQQYRALPVTAYLRAADALHLACATHHGFTEVYSHDRHFLNAAPLFGLSGIDIIL